MTEEQQRQKLEYEFTDYIANANLINGIDAVKIAKKCSEIAITTLQKALADYSQKIDEIVESYVMPIPNPYGEWVRVKNVNRLLSELLEAKAKLDTELSVTQKEGGGEIRNYKETMQE